MSQQTPRGRVQTLSTGRKILDLSWKFHTKCTLRYEPHFYNVTLQPTAAFIIFLKMPVRSSHQIHWTTYLMVFWNFIFSQLNNPHGPGLPQIDVSGPLTMIHHSTYDSSGRGIGPSQKSLPDNTQHLQQTDTHDLGRIQTRNLSKLLATGPRLRCSAIGFGVLELNSKFLLTQLIRIDIIKIAYNYYLHVCVIIATGLHANSCTSCVNPTFLYR